MLGSLLFQMLINYLEWKMNNKALIFFQVVRPKADCEECQRDLTALSGGARKWQAKFSSDRSKIVFVEKTDLSL